MSNAATLGATAPHRGANKPILLRFADDREIAGDRPQLLHGSHTEARPRMVAAAVVTGVLGLFGAGAAVLLHTNTLMYAPACWVLSCGFAAYAIWGGPAFRALGALRRWARLALLAGMCVASVVFIVGSVSQIRFGPAAEAAAGLMNATALGVVAVVFGGAALMAAPAVLSVATVGPALAQRAAAVTVFWSAVVTVAVNAALILALIAPDSGRVGIIIAVAFPILGTLGAVIARARAVVRELAVALDELYVQLHYPGADADLVRAFQAVERAARAGGAPLGRRRNRVIDQHIGVTLAVTATVLTGLPVHRSEKDLQALLNAMAAAGVVLEPERLRSEAAAFVTHLRVRLSRS